MPIYAYRCTRCGHELDALQKFSEPALTDCPACHEPALAKKLTAAGFQLKGGGWYQTDFRNGSKPAAAEAKPDAKADAKAGATTSSDASTTAAGDSTPASKPEAKASAPSAGCGSGCSCH
jgi:putative FmdB family regulatory protein